MPRPPKKYLDSEGLEVNPEYRSYHAARKEAETEEFLAVAGGRSGFETYYPEEYDKELPEDGGWIMVKEVPHTNLAWDVPLLSMWFAVPDNPGGVGRMPNGRKPYKVRIQTPGGDLWLYPHEYTVVNDITQYLGMEPDIEMLSLGGEAVLDEEQLFYLQARGISRTEATKLLLNDIKSQSFAWFNVHPIYAELLGVS
jgi:hypothetical protein